MNRQDFIHGKESAHVNEIYAMCVLQMRQGLLFIFVNVLPSTPCVCVLVGVERERVRVREQCSSCDEHALWHVPEPGMMGKDGEILRSSHFKPFSCSPPSPSTFSQLPIQLCVCVCAHLEHCLCHYYLFLSTFFSFLPPSLSLSLTVSQFHIYFLRKKDLLAR